MALLTSSVAEHAHDVPLAHLEGGVSGEQRRGVTIGTQAQEHQIEARKAGAEDGRELGFCSRGIAGLAVHRVNAGIDVCEQRLAHHPEVGVGVVPRHTALKSKCCIVRFSSNPRSYTNRENDE